MNMPDRTANSRFPRTAPRTCRSEGFAIVLTLLVLTMMTVLVIGFSAATRTEQMAARNYSYQEQANQMAMMGVNRAVAMLNTNLTNYSIRTQPGRLMTLENGAMPLSSASVPGASGTSVNINAWADTNFFIARTTDANAFSAPLVPLSRGTNPIGGYAFWVDDDGTRLALNAASVQARTNFLPTNSRPLVLTRDLFPSINAGNWTTISNGFAAMVDPATATSTTNGWGYFFTPRQMVAISNVGPANYGAMMFQIAGGPPNWRPTNSYALGSNGVPAALDAPGDFLATYGSTSYSNSLNSLTTALDSVAGKFFRGDNYESYFGSTDGFVEKYGENTLRQIIVNINDSTLPTGSRNSPGIVAVTGANNEQDMLSPSGIPRIVAGHRPFPYLNEIASRSFYHFDSTSGVLNMQVWLAFEIANPYGTPWGDASQLRVNFAEWSFEGSCVVGGVKVPIAKVTPSSVISPLEFSLRWEQGVELPQNSYTNLFLALNWNVAVPGNASSIVLTNRVDLDTVRYLQWPEQPTTVRDWAQGDDLPLWEDTAVPLATGPSASWGDVTSVGTPGYVDWTASAATFGVAKNDPRVRRYADWTPPSPPWLPVGANGPAVTIGANNSTVNFSAGTGVPGAPNSDPVTGNNNIMSHPSFALERLALDNPARRWNSAFELSQIHTGLQWRTLQMRAQDQAESGAGSVPDWALLEAFAVTNATVSSPRAFKLNINALPYPASDSMAPAALATAGLSRAGASGSLLSGMTAVNAPLAAVGTNNLGFPAAAGFANPAAAMLVGSNIANMTFTNTWASRRSANTNYLPNMYTLPAEVLEVNGVANFSTDEAANEARAQGVYSGIAVSSQVFTVYAAGFANDKRGEQVAEARLRAQVARDTNSGLFKVIFLEPLIWP